MHADFSGVPVLVDVPHVELIQSMRSMLRSEIIPDVTFMVSGTKFAAHRCILSVRCPVRLFVFVARAAYFALLPL